MDFCVGGFSKVSPMMSYCTACGLRLVPATPLACRTLRFLLAAVYICSGKTCVGFFFCFSIDFAVFVVGFHWYRL